MGVCAFCGEKAGWFHDSHPACQTKVNFTAGTVKDFITSEVVAGKTLGDLLIGVQRILIENGVKEQHVLDVLRQAVNDAVSRVALKSPVAPTEGSDLRTILTHYNITGSPVKRWFAPAQLEMSCILWFVLHDVPFSVDFTPDFNLRRGELPIVQTGNCVTYAEERTVANGNRSYGGLSIPVGGGVYYHVGGSHQERVTGLLPLDGGKILITSHALYFAGQQTTLHVPLDQVLRYQPYLDGVGVCESYGAPKVFVFNYQGMDTGWFFYNLLSQITSKLLRGIDRGGGSRS